MIESGCVPIKSIPNRLSNYPEIKVSKIFKCYIKEERIHIDGGRISPLPAGLSHEYRISYKNSSCMYSTKRMHNEGPSIR